MTEHQRQATDRPAAERYYAQYGALGVDPGGPRRRTFKRRSTREHARVGSLRPQGMRVLVTVSPRIYREALEFSLQNSRPDLEVRAAAPEDAELELAGFRPHLLVYNDTDELGSEALAGVLCHIEVPYTDGMNARVRAGETSSLLRDMSTEDLLRAVDVTATVGVLH